MKQEFGEAPVLIETAGDSVMMFSDEKNHAEIIVRFAWRLRCLVERRHKFFMEYFEYNLEYRIGCATGMITSGINHGYQTYQVYGYPVILAARMEQSAPKFPNNPIQITEETKQELPENAFHMKPRSTTIKHGDCVQTYLILGYKNAIATRLSQRNINKLDILIIDDSMSTLSLFKRHLEKEFNVTIVRKWNGDNGAKQKMSHHQTFHIVMIDIYLNHVSGFEIASHIASNSKNSCQHVPVIIGMTADEITEDMRISAKISGMQCLWEKRFNHKPLIKSLKDIYLKSR